jgi:hypothetical protein
MNDETKPDETKPEQDAGAGSAGASPAAKLETLASEPAPTATVAAEEVVKSDVILAPSTSGSRGSAPIALAVAKPVTPVPLSWRSWPIVDSLGEFFLLAAALLGGPIVVFQYAGVGYALFTAAALVFVAWRHFVPTQFELSALGVTQTRVGRSQRIPWISIDRYLIGRTGVYLSSAGAPLEMFRGLYLPWGKHREQILTTLRYYLPRAEEVREG